MARRPAKPQTPPPEEAPQETEGAVTAPDAPEEAPAEITIAFPLEPRTAAPEDAPLLLRVDH